MTDSDPVVFTPEEQSAYQAWRRFMDNVASGDDAANDDLVEEIRAAGKSEK